MGDSNRRAASGEIHIDQFSIQSGNWQQEPGNIRILRSAPRRSRRGRGSLLMVFEPTHQSKPPRALYDQVAEVISNTYYGLSGSLTRGLRDGLLAANELLFERNLREDSAHHVALGLTCVVLRDDQVFIGRIGPSLVSHIHAGRLTRFPPDSIWWVTESPPAAALNREPPAGSRREVEPDLYHASVAAGDVLLISTTSLARLTSEQALLGAVAHSRGGRLRDALEALSSGRDVSVAIVEWPAEEEGLETVPPTLEPAEPTSAGRAKVGESSAPVPYSGAAPRGDTEETRPVRIESVSPPPEEATPPTPSPPPAEREQPSAEEPPWVEESAKPQTEAAEETAVETPEEEPVAGRRSAPRGPDFAAIAGTLRRGAQRLSAGISETLLRILPERIPEPPAPSPQELVVAQPSISLSGRALVLIALVIPLLMLFLVVMARIQYERLQQQQFIELRDRARLEYDTAIKMENPIHIRKGLHQALDTIEDGLAINPHDEGLRELQRRIVHTLDEVDVVERFYHLWKLVNLKDLPGARSIAALGMAAGEQASARAVSSHIVIQGVDVYLLARGSDIVYKFLLNDVGDALQSVGSKSVLMRRGEIYGGVEVGDIVDIAWLEAKDQRTTSAFVALERSGSLLTYDPQTGIDALPVADSDMWLNPQAIAGYYGNLYVLDPLLGRILKYVPDEDEYTVPPSDYLDPRLDIDLTGAIDMTIDGNLYVLFADGRVRKFYNGEPQPFNSQSAPSPMNNPSCIFVSGPPEPDGPGYVYVADTGNQRILQFTKSGDYVRQFRDKPGESHLHDLRGIYVDEANQRMFILSGETLWLASIPPLTGG